MLFFKKILLILVTILHGCSLAPKYSVPDVAMPKNWTDSFIKNKEKNSIAPINLGWREFFTDLRLQKLIVTALTYNHDLQTAALNIEMARAQYNIVNSSSLPSLGLNAKSSRTKKGKIMGRSIIDNGYSVGLGISNFELDFFGHIKNKSQVAVNKYLATKEARDILQLSIINTIAKTYYQWRVAKALKKLAQQTLIARKKSYQLTKMRFENGQGSGVDLSATINAITMAELAYQQQIKSIKQIESTLAKLIGIPLSNIELPKGKLLTQQFPKITLFAGIPSQVLLNRPDIKQAEFNLKSINANIGVARAMMFPSISLTTTAGYASNDLDTLINNSRLSWSIIPSLNFPLFDMGKRKTNVEISKIRKKIAIENYRKVVKAAFYDINNALIARKSLKKQYQIEKRGQIASAETLRLIKQQMQKGLVTGLTLLDAERTDFAKRKSILNILLQVTNNKVDLYTALGGGLIEKINKN